MERQVIARDRQRLIAADLNNVQSFTREAIDHIVLDAIGQASRFIGFSVVQNSAAEVAVAPGRLYAGGLVHGREADQLIDLLTMLPVAAKRMVAIVSWGLETETDIQTRRFMIDAATRTTEPSDVAMRRERAAQLDGIAGVESAAPQLPVIDAAQLHVATVTLTPTGIESIEMVEENRLVSIQDLHGRVVILENWRAYAEPLISTMRSDIAGNAAAISGLVPSEVVVGMMIDLAMLKERLDLDDTASDYGSDKFWTEDESDTGAAGYAAYVGNGGLTFPLAGETNAALALNNPDDPDVSMSSGLALPAYEEETRISVDGYAGDLLLSQHQSQSIDLKEQTIQRAALTYGNGRY